MDIEINDVRSEKELKVVSFSGYKKTDVVKQLYESLTTSKLFIISNFLIVCSKFVCFTLLNK